MNPNPNVFGPHFWFVMHTVSFFYPENPTSTDMKRHKDFYESFVHMIPCGECSQHYSVLLTRYPIDGHLQSRNQLSRWVVFIHNKVNEKLGKRYMEYDDVVQYYRSAYSNTNTLSLPAKTRSIVFFVCLAAGLFVFYERVYMKKKIF